MAPHRTKHKAIAIILRSSSSSKKKLHCNYLKIYSLLMDFLAQATKTPADPLDPLNSSSVAPHSRRHMTIRFCSAPISLHQPLGRRLLPSTGSLPMRPLTGAHARGWSHSHRAISRQCPKATRGDARAGTQLPVQDMVNNRCRTSSFDYPTIHANYQGGPRPGDF